jgi:hypothetical protein
MSPAAIGPSLKEHSLFMVAARSRAHLRQLHAADMLKLDRSSMRLSD